MDGLGGSRPWKEYLAIEHKNKDLIIAYVEEGIPSVAAIYLAMNRAKDLT